MSLSLKKKTDAPPITAAPRRLELMPSNLDSLNWSNLVVGLDRFDPKKKLASLSGPAMGGQSSSVGANFLGSRAAAPQVGVGG
jgi:hypothetical protein